MFRVARKMNVAKSRRILEEYLLGYVHTAGSSD